MGAATNALINLKYFRLITNIKEDSVNYPDQVIEELIDQASQMLESECNCKFRTPAAAIEEIFSRK